MSGALYVRRCSLPLNHKGRHAVIVARHNDYAVSTSDFFLMQHPLSPKKYIQTRARTLPIYKCFVNKDWRAIDIANVFVMRQHVNGHITAGVYLVDLLCLGIKDTFFFFNEEE